MCCSVFCSARCSDLLVINSVLCVVVYAPIFDSSAGCVAACVVMGFGR